MRHFVRQSVNGGKVGAFNEYYEIIFTFNLSRENYHLFYLRNIFKKHEGSEDKNNMQVILMPIETSMEKRNKKLSTKNFHYSRF